MTKETIKTIFEEEFENSEMVLVMKMAQDFNKPQYDLMIKLFKPFLKNSLITVLKSLEKHNEELKFERCDSKDTPFPDSKDIRFKRNGAYIGEVAGINHNQSLEQSNNHIKSLIEEIENV